jgi:hypothetical protein
MRTKKLGYYLGSTYEIEPEEFVYVKKRKSNWLKDNKIRRI